MKKKIKLLLTGLICLTATYSCDDDFLDQPPLGAISESSITNAAGLQGSLIQAYRSLTGLNVGAWYTSANNWVWGSVRSEEAYKGTEASDQNQLNPIERYEVLPNNGSVLGKWNGSYDGIAMANIVLRLIPEVQDMSDAAKLQVEAQAKFIRGFLHFEAKRTFNKAPFVGEDVVTIADFQAVKNDSDIYPQIEADLLFAYTNLPVTQSQIGRVNKWAAGAFLAKAYLYQKKFGDAKTIFDAIIADGVNSSGDKFDLNEKFSDTFRGEFENGPEVVFSIQATVGDGTGGANSNKEMELTNPHSDGPGGCCGFFQPTQTLANSFKTSLGMPVANPQTTNIKQHENSPADFPDRGEFDPRIDHTVGRVGIQYLDWGPAKSSWIRLLANGGPFIPKKNVHTSEEVGSYHIPGAWGQAQSGRNTLVMRFADLLLMAAECEIEVGSLEKAREYINRVRTRAANPDDFVKSGGVNEANYSITNYLVPFASKAEATTAVRLERLLELAMEGHRFYDLVRWGTAETVLTEFITREKAIRTHLNGAVFTSPVDDYLPIPEYVLAQSTGNITAN